MRLFYPKNYKKLSLSCILSFLLTLLLCSYVIGLTVVNRLNVERLTMEQLIMEKSIKINQTISKLIYKTQALSALVIQSDGEIKDFDRVAEAVVDNPAIANILVAPGGVVSQVYPLEQNKALVGYNLLGQGAGNREAIMAKQSGQLVFGGPFTLMQGGQALVGRLPVFLRAPASGKKFWGLVSVTLKYPQALGGAELYLLEAQGFHYEIWRINPDNGQRQTIAGYNKSPTTTHFVEKRIQLFNATWHFRITPVRAWYEYPETWLLIFSGLFISFLVAFTTQKNVELKIARSRLEKLASIDPVAKIANRRHFFELAPQYMEKALRTNGNCFIVLFDVDLFKKINDRYGHVTGDKVLRRIARRAKNSIRPYDLLARYGGEEFIMLISDIDKSAVRELVERVRENIARTPIRTSGAQISVTASFGIAQAAPDNDFKTAIDLADKALYEAKDAGRNKTVFFNEKTI